eukprot:6480253-Amphidinium_carterae.1
MVGAGCVGLARLLDTSSFVTMLLASSSSLYGSFPVASLDVLLSEHRVFPLDWIVHSSVFCLAIVMPPSQTWSPRTIMPFDKLFDLLLIKPMCALLMFLYSVNLMLKSGSIFALCHGARSTLRVSFAGGPGRGWLSVMSTWPSRFCAELAKIFASEAVKSELIVDLAHNLQKGHRKHQPSGSAMPQVMQMKNIPN